MSKEAMKQALEALERAPANTISQAARIGEAITALREALAEQPTQTDWEAVAADQAMTIAMLKSERKPWVGLTDQEIDDLWNQHESRFDFYSFYCDIEDKLREKNRITGEKK